MAPHPRRSGRRRSGTGCPWMASPRCGCSIRISTNRTPGIQTRKEGAHHVRRRPTPVTYTLFVQRQSKAPDLALTRTPASPTSRARPTPPAARPGGSGSHPGAAWPSLRPVAAATQAPPALSPNATVFATGLNNPRSLTFGPDGMLYVAEGGTGGTRSPVGICQQAPAPAGPYPGGMTARISRISSAGVAPPSRPSALRPDEPQERQAGQRGGGSDLHGRHPLRAPLGRGLLPWRGRHRQRHHPVSSTGSDAAGRRSERLPGAQSGGLPRPDDAEPDGTWYGLVATGGASTPPSPTTNRSCASPRLGGQPAGRLLGDLSWRAELASAPALTVQGGKLYVGFLTPFPIVVGASNISQVGLTGRSMCRGGPDGVLGRGLPQGPALCCWR